MGKIIRCKFQLKSITASYNDSRSFVMEPVYDSDPNSENGKFFKATPSGRLEVFTVNKEAVEGLELGKNYYIDITPAD
jgi:hypothetical protein